jgi:muramoyltetrapeptide carboxypeptidase LdcA involved in peptidoglycan recycling
MKVPGELKGETMLKPRKLAPGDKIAAVTLAWGGPGTFPHRYEIGKKQLQDTLGVEIVESPHALKDPVWIAAHPEARAADLMEAFSDPSIRGIVSTIGGDDSIRLLPYLDLDVIRSNPKVFLGYSDTTVTHFACLKAGIVSFYGPSIMAGFAENGGPFPYMIDSVRRTLFSADPIGVIEPNTEGWTVEYLDWSVPENQERKRALNPSEPWRFLQGEGIAEGRFVGGCLDVMEFLRGTALWPDDDIWEGAILFLETSEEAPPPTVLKRALRTYAAMGILGKLSGLLFGRPGGAVPVEDFKKYDQAILDVVVEEEGLTGLPVVTRMDFGHTDPMFVLPYGLRARIDCESGQLSLPEGAVDE